MPQGYRNDRRARRHRPRRYGRLAAAIAAALVLVVTLAVIRESTRDDPALSASEPAADTPASWSSAAYSGGPRLAVDRASVDYGDVDYGEPIEATYRLKNVGDEVALIDQPSIKTLEGC